MITQSAPVLEALARLRWFKRTAERSTARVQFALQRTERLTPLSEEQVRQYHRDGYLLVSGLIPEAVARGAEAAMRQAIGLSDDGPQTWPRVDPPARRLKEERFVAAYTDAMIAAAAQLAGEDVASFLRPSRVLTVNVVPVTGEWQPHEAHIDYVIPESRYKTFPRPFRIGAMTYLTDVPPHGGGTVVWPGAHVKLEALARSDMSRYKYLAALFSDLHKITIGSPVELTPSRGDVLFHDYLCVHAGSKNVSGKPRLAINHKW